MTILKSYIKQKIKKLKSNLSLLNLSHIMETKSKINCLKNTLNLNPSSSLTLINQDKYLSWTCNATSTEDIDVSTQSNRIKLDLIKYVYPFLIVFGLLGNLLSFKVMLKRFRCEKEKSSLSLAILSLADLAIILLGPTRELLENTFHLEIKSYSGLTCKFIFYAAYLLSAFSAYIFAYISYERYQAIAHPIQYKQKSLGRTFFQIGFILAFCAAITVPFFVFSTLIANVKLDGVDRLDVKRRCEISSHVYFELIIFDASLYFGTPFSVIIVFSMLSFGKLIRNKNCLSISLFGRMKSSPMSKKASVKSSRVSSRNPSTIELLKIKRTFEPNVYKKRGMNSFFQVKNLTPSVEIVVKSNDETDSIENSTFHSNNPNLAVRKENAFILKNAESLSKSKITLMLLFLPILYLITNFPVFLFILLEIFSSKDTIESYDLAFHLSRIFMYVNNCLNVLFFILIGKHFRKDLFKF